MDSVQTLVVQRDGQMDSQTVFTPHGVPNIVITVISPLRIVVVRALRVFLQTLVGLLTAGATGLAPNALPAGNFGHLLMTCASLAVAPAAICVIQNTIELLARLDESAPQLRP